jgi:hypothetical protein
VALAVRFANSGTERIAKTKIIELGITAAGKYRQALIPFVVIGLNQKINYE